MAHYKYIDTSLRFIAVDLQRQLLPGSNGRKTQRCYVCKFDLFFVLGTLNTYQLSCFSGIGKTEYSEFLCCKYFVALRAAWHNRTPFNL